MTDPIESARVIEYRDEVIVELQGTDEHGAIDVVSYQFSYGDDGRTLSPRGPVDDGHASLVRETLEEGGFRSAAGND